MSMFNKIKDILTVKGNEVNIDEDYIELEPEGIPQKKGKVIVKLFALKEFDDIKDVLSAIREGYTISIINISTIKERDMMGLKRAIDKLKKTVEVSNGDLAGISENLLIATPSFARVHRGSKEQEMPKTEVVE